MLYPAGSGTRAMPSEPAPVLNHPPRLSSLRIVRSARFARRRGAGALALALAHIVSERAMSFGVKARAAAQAGATAAVAYLAARVAEEQLDFGRIDCVLGLRDVMDGEEMFWRTQHADGQPVPSVSTVLRDNAASSQKRTADALTKSVTEHREFSVSAHDSHVQGGGVGAHVVGCAPRGAVLSFCAPSNSNCC